LSAKKYGEVAIRSDQFPTAFAAGLFVWQDVYFVDGRERYLLLGCCTAITYDDVTFTPWTQVSDEEAHLPFLWSAMKRTAVSSIAPTMRKLHSESRRPKLVELCIAFSGYQRKPPEEQLLWGKAKVGFCPYRPYPSLRRLAP